MFIVTQNKHMCDIHFQMQLMIYMFSKNLLIVYLSCEIPTCP